MSALLEPLDYALLQRAFAEAVLMGAVCGLLGVLVLIAPMADPMPYTHHFALALGFSEPTRQRFLKLMERRAGRPLAELDLPLRAFDSRRALPATLIVHDRDDRETDHEDGVALAQAWPKASLESTNGLGHRRILQDQATVRMIVDRLSG